MTTSPGLAQIGCIRAQGCYVLIAVAPKYGNVERYLMSVGGAEVLIAELAGAIDQRPLRERISTTTGELVPETDEQISCALRWYRRRGSRGQLMARIDELESLLAERTGDA